jgi:hypothetical protein
MKLEKVDGFGCKVLQAALDKGSQVRAVIAIGQMRIEPPPGFGRHVDGFLALLA